MKRAELASKIDHTILKCDTSAADVDRVCAEAIELGCAAVCVNGRWVTRVVERLAGRGVKTAAVIGFPLGAMATEIKVAETKQVVRDGAVEVDMVMDVGAIKDRDYDRLRKDIRAVVEAAGAAAVKVIVETAVLDGTEKTRAAIIAADAGAAFVKTSTGFGGAGASIADVRMFHEIVGKKVQIKASGGIKAAQQAIDLLDAGASRLGVSGTVALLGGLAV